MTGQSGHPGSRHYDDLVDAWMAGRTNPVAQPAEATLTLQAERRVTPARKPAPYTAPPMWGRGSRALAAAARTALACAAATTTASAASLYDGPGPRPGPDILYEPPAARAAAREHRRLEAPRRSSSPARPPTASGEFLYQDFLYDDHGARCVRDPGDPRPGRRHLLASRTAPTATRPTAGVRATTPPTSSSCASSRCADATAVPAHAQHDDRPERGRRDDRDRRHAGAAAACPYGANVDAPAQFFLTWHGNDRGARATPPPARPSARRRRSSVDIDAPPDRRCACRTPRGTRARARSSMAAGVGLWDAAANAYRAAARRPRPPTAPGGARSPGSAARSSTSPSALQRADCPTSANRPQLLAQPGLVARPARRAQQLRDRQPRRRSSRTSTSPSSPPAPTTTPACRRPARSTASSPRTSRPSRASTSTSECGSAHQSARASCAAGSSRTRSTCPRKKGPRAATA